MDSMFKVTFRDAHTENDLTGGIFLPDVPAPGDAVHIRERIYHGRSQFGHITSRHWHIATKEPGESEAVVFVALDLSSLPED